MAENSSPAYDLLPSRVEARGDVGTGTEHGAEPELDVRFVEREATFDFGPVLGEAAGVDEDDSVFGDSKILEMRVDGENSALPPGPGGDRESGRAKSRSARIASRA